RLWLSPLALAFALGASGQSSGADKSVSFGALERPDPAAVKARVDAWLKQSGNAAANTRLEAIWKDEDRSLLERVAEGIALGSPDAAKLLAEARDPGVPAPVEVAAFFKDAKVPLFVRANV